jgi:hypothetical protein
LTFISRRRKLSGSRGLEAPPIVVTWTEEMRLVVDEAAGGVEYEVRRSEEKGDLGIV